MLLKLSWFFLPNYLGKLINPVEKVSLENVTISENLLYLFSAVNHT